MYSYLRGVFRGQPGGSGEPLIVEAGGIGYEVLVPPIVEREIADCYSLDAPILLYVSATSTRDQPWPEVLFGFLRPEEKAFWQLLKSVPRIGGKGAARAMAAPVDAIAAAIQQGNKSYLDSLPGITLDGADRIIASLRKKVGPFLQAAQPSTRPARVGPLEEMRQDAVDLLVSMGVKRLDAQRSVDGLLSQRDDFVSVQELLTEYFRATRAQQAHASP